MEKFTYDTKSLINSPKIKPYPNLSFLDLVELILQELPYLPNLTEQHIKPSKSTRPSKHTEPFRSSGHSDLLNWLDLTYLPDHLENCEPCYHRTSSFKEISNQLNFWKFCSGCGSNDHSILLFIITWIFHKCLAKLKVHENTWNLQHNFIKVSNPGHCVVHVIETARDTAFTKSLNSPGEPFNVPWHSNVCQKVQWKDTYKKPRKTSQFSMSFKKSTLQVFV